jgi:hypothetical protein
MLFILAEHAHHKLVTSAATLNTVMATQKAPPLAGRKNK